jgi:hypothetical protein
MKENHRDYFSKFIAIQSKLKNNSFRTKLISEAFIDIENLEDAKIRKEFRQLGWNSIFGLSGRCPNGSVNSLGAKGLRFLLRQELVDWGHGVVQRIVRFVDIGRVCCRSISESKSSSKSVGKD